MVSRCIPKAPKKSWKVFLFEIKAHIMTSCRGMLCRTLAGKTECIINLLIQVNLATQTLGLDTAAVICQKSNLHSTIDRCLSPATFRPVLQSSKGTHRSRAGVGLRNLVIHLLSTVLSHPYVFWIRVCCWSAKSYNNNNNIK